MIRGKFTQVLGDSFRFRRTGPEDRTEDGYEILKVSLDDPTEFGQSGALLCWFGGEKKFDWDSYDSDGDWGASNYFFEFQLYLEFFTSPSKLKGIRRLTLYTPRDDWSEFQDVIVDEVEYKGDQSSDEDLDFETLLVDLLGRKYQLSKISDADAKRFIEDIER